MIRIRLERPDPSELKDGLTYWEDGECRYHAVIEQLVDVTNGREPDVWLPVEVVYPDE